MLIQNEFIYNCILVVQCILIFCKIVQVAALHKLTISMMLRRPSDSAVVVGLESGLKSSPHPRPSVSAGKSRYEMYCMLTLLFVSLVTYIILVYDKCYQHDIKHHKK